MQKTTIVARAASSCMALALLALVGLAGATQGDDPIAFRSAPRRFSLAGRTTDAKIPRVHLLHNTAAAPDVAEKTAPKIPSGSLMETGATAALTQEHLRALTDLVEEKLRVAPTHTLASISGMLRSANYAGAGQICLDFAGMGNAQTPTTTTAPKLHDTLPGTYNAANFTCPPSATNLGDLTCTGWSGNMPWKHYIQFSQAQKPQLSIYDCAKMCKMSPGCRYYWWQIAVKPKALAVCSLIHDTKEHGLAGCTGNPMMSFPYAGQRSNAEYCPLVLNTRSEIGSGSLTCAGVSPQTHKDCIYQMRKAASPAVS